jgi:hypothetical protein
MRRPDMCKGAVRFRISGGHPGSTGDGYTLTLLLSLFYLLAFWSAEQDRDTLS